jgi:hypothetical protein
MSGSRRRWVAAALRFVSALGVVASGVAASPAVVHADSAGPTDYESEIVAITPAAPEIEVSTEGGDSFLRIAVEPGHEVVIHGYDDEPYLRIDPAGDVLRNVRSYATYYNEDRLGDVEIPDLVDNDAEPEWERVGGGGSWAWHDHRTHWMAEEPPIGLEAGDAITTAPVPVTVDGRLVEIEVRTVLLDDPSPWPPLFGALVGVQLGLLAVYLGPATAVLATLLLSAAALVVGASQYWSLPAETGPLITWWLLPALALGCVLAVIATYGRSSWLRIGLLALAALELVVWAVRRRDVFTSAVLPTDLSFGLDRGVTGAVLAGAVVVLIGVGRELLRD